MALSVQCSFHPHTLRFCGSSGRTTHGLLTDAFVRVLVGTLCLKVVFFVRFQFGNACCLRFNLINFNLTFTSIRNLRVGHRFVQAHVLQCDTEFGQNMDSRRAGCDFVVRVSKVADIFVATEQGALLDDRTVCNVDFLALLRLVVVHKLLQRRIL